MITLRDYAKKNNISYEAVRKQVARYKKELDTHIIKDGRKQLLDEEAVIFLDSKREKNPVVILQQDKDDTIKALEVENKNLLQQIVILQDKQLQLQSELTEQKLLTAKTAEVEIALTVAQEKSETAEQIAEMNAQEAAQAKAEVAELLKRAETAEAEAERLKNRKFFQRLLNK